jgi:prepilin-type N-terminal cleavage/methylation domain-containing protein
MRSSSVKRNSGFTLIELLISIAIIGIVTAIVVMKYKSFDSTTLLKSTSYEIALALREMQIHSISALRHDRDDDSNFDYPYGISFTSGANTYKIFQFTSPTEYPNYDTSSYAEDLSTVTLDRSIRVVDLCIDDTTCAQDRVDISFKRPEFKAYFYVPGNSQVENEAISNVVIKVSSPNNATNVFKVIVSRLGQISVEKQ